jgi:hypothetical protein
VNHNVQECMSGCLTVKFLGSWKTVKGSLAMTVESGAGLPLVVDGPEGDGAVLLLSGESLSMPSAGGTGERTSVMVDSGWIVWVGGKALAVGLTWAQMGCFWCCVWGDGGGEIWRREKQWNEGATACPRREMVWGARGIQMKIRFFRFFEWRSRDRNFRVYVIDEHVWRTFDDAAPLSIALLALAGSQKLAELNVTARSNRHNIA